MMKNNKTRISAIDFIRVVSAIGIIASHFFPVSNSTLNKLMNINGCGIGKIFVTIFFMVSGAMLYYNDQEIVSLKSFYFKRWKSIFPPFYIAFLYYFFEEAFQIGKIFSRGNPITLLLSAIGFDGYFLYKIPNYYQIGEWFLGAIIIVYIIYPLLLKAFNCQPIVTVCLITVCSFIFYFNGYFGIDYIVHLGGCIISFTIGMLFIKYKHEILDKKYLAAVAAVLCVLLYTSELLKSYADLKSVIAGIALFIVLYQSGNTICKSSFILIVVEKLSAYTYCVFLLQHKVIFKVFDITNPTNTLKALILFIFTVVLIWIYAWGLKKVSDGILRTKWFNKINNFFNL